MKLLLIYFSNIYNLYAEIPSQLKKKISNTSVQINWSDIDKDILNLVIKNRDVIINKLIPIQDKSTKIV